MPDEFRLREFEMTADRSSSSSSLLSATNTIETGGVLVCSGTKVGPPCQFNSDPVSFNCRFEY